MITASNAKSSRSGPLLNVNVVRMPRKTPATATMPSDSAMARPYSRRLSMPISSAVSWSSEVARNARPTASRLMRYCSPTRISTATASVMKGNQPMASCDPSARLAVSMPPGFSRRESAENVSSKAFWMMMENPNVTRIGGRMPRPRRRLRTSVWSP